MKEGLIGFAAKTKTRGKPEGRPRGGGPSNFSFSNEKWLADGRVLFQNNTGGSPRDFWIGRPLVSESELGFPNRAPAFWPCANKMMSLLLFLAYRTEDHGIRPLSLKVTTIDLLTGQLPKEWRISPN